MGPCLRADVQQQPQHLYDRATTVFSPNGRIYQVEYAREVVKRGSTVVGVTAEDGVGFLSGRRESSRLAIQDSVEKIFRVDDHVGAASCGLVADARTLVDMARNLSAGNKIRYEEPMHVETLARDLSTRIHGYTQTGGARPFGVSMLIGGLNDEAKLFETDPSGAFIGYKAGALGSRREEVMDKLEDNFEEDLPLDEALARGYEAMVEDQGIEEPREEIEGAAVTGDGFRRLDPEEIEDLAAST
jgi:proteasome alpha subunit